jgi:hypothetical protein
LIVESNGTEGKERKMQQVTFCVVRLENIWKRKKKEKVQQVELYKKDLVCLRLFIVFKRN